MAEFYMNENGDIIKEKATVEDLKNWVKEYQRRYFGGTEAKISIAISSEAGEGGCFKPTQKLIIVPQALTAFEKPCRILLLHELVHLNLMNDNGDPEPDHGLRFKSEIERLIEQGAYNNLL
jgi:predicted metal-dependent hydrolase